MNNKAKHLLFLIYSLFYLLLGEIHLATIGTPGETRTCYLALRRYQWKR